MADPTDLGPGDPLVLTQGDVWYVAFRVDEPVIDPETGEQAVSNGASVYSPMDLAGREARMHCRPWAGAPELRFGFDSADPVPRLFVQPPRDDHPDLGDPGDPDDPLTGWIVLWVGAAETAGYARGGVFDLKVYRPGDPADRFTAVPATPLVVVPTVTT